MSFAPRNSVGGFLRPVHRWVWGDFDRRVRKLLIFAEVETDGGRDILRAAELTSDPLLRRLYLEHAIDELRHGELFRQRSAALLRTRAARSGGFFNSHPLPGGHGLEDLRIDQESDERLLAFLHVAERAAAGRFAIYREVVGDDPPTRAIFEEILRDEVFHMNYTRTQLVRIAPQSHRRRIWWARATRLWQRFAGFGALVGGLVAAAGLTIIFFLVLPPFAWLARRAARREAAGWAPCRSERSDRARSLY